MAGRDHRYAVRLTWSGNRGTGTSAYRAYDRAHEIAGNGKASIHGSSDPSFLGDPSRWNPEELLLASLAACHQLWYLHLCASAGVIVIAYEDRAEGVMREEADGGGAFVRVILKPVVTITATSDRTLAERLHGEVPAKCFIARSVNFPVEHAAEIVVAPA